MSAPEPIETAAGVRLFPLSTDGVTPSIWVAYFAATLSGTSYAHAGVYVISGTPKTGYAVTTGTGAFQLPSVVVDGAVVKASPDNTADIWVGASTITFNKTATDGYRLAPGESIGVACRQLNTVYIRDDNTAGRQGVYYSAQGAS